jgi:chemotaxis protein methyltransferase CheR
MTRGDLPGGGRLPADPAIQPISEKEFALFQTLIHREAGIYLSPVKKALVEGRLSKRLRELGLNSFGAYYCRVVEDGDREELVRLLDCICTNETHFFREPQHFEFLEKHVFPEWTAQAASGFRARRVRVWSAACSTGEEPYSVAMLLWAVFPPVSGWVIEILATDLSTRALDRAETAIWPIEKSQEIPARFLKPCMLRGTRSQIGKMKVNPEIRSIVRFERLNLIDNAYPMTDRFDLIFCRNVLIYFDPELRLRVVQQLLNHLAPKGYLFLGHAETLNGLGERVRSVIPTVYAHAGQEPSSGEAGAATPGGTR